MKNYKTFFFVALALAFTSCETFPEGGSLKRADKNLEGTWTLGSYLRDGQTATNEVLITNLTETFSSGGEYSRSYVKSDQTVVEETGDWSMENDNLSVNISGVSSIDGFSNENSTLSTSEIILVRLKGDELWYEYENGGNQHEFRMNRK